LVSKSKVAVAAIILRLSCTRLGGYRYDFLTCYIHFCGGSFMYVESGTIEWHYGEAAKLAGICTFLHSALTCSQNHFGNTIKSRALSILRLHFTTPRTKRVHVDMALSAREVIRFTATGLLDSILSRGEVKGNLLRCCRLYGETRTISMSICLAGRTSSFEQV
jgi:hypothetical protein